MPWWAILIIVVACVLILGWYIWLAFANARKRKAAKERFSSDRVSQDTKIKQLAASEYAWTPADIERGQGRKAIDAASTNKGDNIDSNGGIYAFYIDYPDFDTSDFFLPVYVGKTTNFRRRWMEHIKKIRDAYLYNQVGKRRSELKYKKIANFLHTKNLQVKDIRFVVLEVIDPMDYGTISKQEENKFIMETGAGERGFNSDNA